MQDCRLMTEPCQCPRCRCEMHMSCQEKCMPSAKCCNMGGFPLETQLSYDSNCQRSCWQNRSDPQEVFQNFTPGNPQKLPQDSARNWNCQPPLNCFYGQQSPRQVTQEPRQQFPQDSCQQFSQDSCQQFSQDSCQLFPQKPSQRSQRKCCFQLPPQKCCQQPPGSQFQEDFEGQNITRRRVCYCVTHEMGVQTEVEECKCNTDQTQRPLPMEEGAEDCKCKKDLAETPCPTNEEEECRCKRDQAETPCPCREEARDSPELDYIAVTELTTKEMEVKHRTGTKDIFIEKVQSVTHFPTDPHQAITKIHTVEKTQKSKPEKIKEKDIVPLRTLRKSELEPMVESMKAVVPKSGSQSETGELIYHKYETYERDFGDSKKTPKKSTNKFKTPVGSPPSRISKPPSPTNRSPTYRSPTRLSPNKPLSLSPTDNISRSESGRDTGASNSDLNTSVVNEEDISKPFVIISSDNSDEKEEEIKPKVPKERKRIPSDYDNVSTVHVRVTHRKEASVKRPNDKETNKNMTAVVESRVSQVMLKERGEKKPDDKKPEETKPEEKKPEERKPEERKPEEKKPSEKKPREKKPKIIPSPKMEMKQGYPSNDLICRFANPPKCRPTCRTFRSPCPPSNSFNSCKSFNQCPSRIPSTRQYDPIYGFGSKCVAYYCR